MSEPAVRFTYTCRSAPSPLTVSNGTQPSPGSVTVLVRNATGDDVSCDHITFAFAQGDGEAAFSKTNDMGDVEKGCPSRWSFTKAPGEQQAGRFVAKPDNETVPRGARLQFVFNNIPVNTCAGQAQLVVTEQTDGTKKKTNLYVAKSETGFVLRDFAPALPDIQVGTQTDLSWTASLPTPGSTLRVTYGPGTTEDVTKKNTYKTARLYEDTAFTLVAEIPPPSGTQPVRYPLSTFVTVNNGYLTTTDLTVEAEFLALGPRTPVPMPALPTETFDGQPHTLQAIAGTDGFLIGSLRSFTKDATGILEIAVKSGPADPHVTVLRCAGVGDPDPYTTGRPVTIPVPNASAITVTWTMSAPDWPPTSAKDATIPFTTIFTWHPWGIGTLQAGPIH